MGLLSLLGAEVVKVPVTIASLIEMVITVLTSFFTAIPSLFVKAFDGFVSNSDGTFSVLFMWIVVLMFIGLAIKLIMSVLNKARGN